MAADPSTLTPAALKAAQEFNSAVDQRLLAQMAQKGFFGLPVDSAPPAAGEPEPDDDDKPAMPLRQQSYRVVSK